MRRFLLGFFLSSLGGIALLLMIGFYLSPQDPLKQVDAIVVISGGDTRSRTETGIKLWQEGLGLWLIFSGAAKEGVSNARVMKNLAQAAGVPSAQILLEEKSQNTLENAAYVTSLLQERNLGSIILVTSPYHQRRAYQAFRETWGKDFVILNHSARDEEWRKKNWWQNPAAFYLTLTELQKILFTAFINR